MRRAIPVVAATAGGIALLANFHTTPEGKVRTVAAGAASTTVPGSTSTVPPTSESTTTVAPTTTSGGPTTTVRTTTTTQAARRTVDGPDVYTDYGDVQVRAVLQGSRLVDVEALTLPSDRARSQRLSDYAGPQLRQEAIQAQSARIDIVSGATYTSEAYVQSLQGALDRARA